MPSRLPTDFLSLDNFLLAWERIVRGSNIQYKRFFSHLFPSFEFAHRTVLKELVAEVRAGLYQPSEAITVHFPKPTRILRPITLLCLKDQVVYQALANFIANRFFRSLRANYGVKTFGALYAGRASKFFYRPWKKAYRAFNQATKQAYFSGNTVLADFDLVSFFDLIDHKILRKVLERQVRSGEVLDLLGVCLEKWTSGNPRTYLRGHGIPQGPEPSAFLAEILLSDFDGLKYGRVQYLRYVDDIKLLAKDFSPLRRALVRLDLQSKRLGLVPQAQKIDVRRVIDINDELKSVPSSIAGAVTPQAPRPLSKSTRRRLRRLLRGSLQRRRGDVLVVDETHFKFALSRLAPYRRVLRSIGKLFHTRPDLSRVLGNYASRFIKDRECADILHNALKGDPVFDAAAGDYIMALDICAPQPEPRKYRRFVSGLMRRSEEQSLLLHVPSKFFALKRAGKTATAQGIENETQPVSAGLLIHHTLLDHRHRFMSPVDLRAAIRKFSYSSPNDDLARYSTYLMLAELQRLPARPTPAGALLLRHLGLPVPPTRTSLLPRFFKDLFGLTYSLDWERLMGKKAHGEAQRRAVSIRGQWAGNPSVLITVVDAFNDLLIQRFSVRHKKLRQPFRKMAGKSKVPDLGNWLRAPSLTRILPKSCPIFIDCHDLRVRADVAHATLKKTGQFTRPVGYQESKKMLRRLSTAYRELLAELGKL